MFVTRFHGTQRACHVGEGSGDITPCSKPECRVCGILKHGFQLKYANSGGMFGPGIYSTTASSSKNTRTLGFRLAFLPLALQKPISTQRTIMSARTDTSFSSAVSLAIGPSSSTRPSPADAARMRIITVYVVTLPQDTHG